MTTTYTTTKGATVTLPTSTVAALLADVSDDLLDRLTTVCLDCGSVTVAASVGQVAIVQDNFDLTCCGVTLHL